MTFKELRKCFASRFTENMFFIAVILLVAIVINGLIHAIAYICDVSGATGAVILFTIATFIMTIADCFIKVWEVK